MRLSQQSPESPVLASEREPADPQGLSAQQPEQDAEETFVNPAEDEYGKEWAFFSPDGSAYKGTWRKALRHGFGVNVYVNGDLYKGEFKKNLPDGRGQFYAHSEPKLTKKDKKQIIQRPEDRERYPFLTLVYDGEWAAGFRSGFGRFFYGPDEFYCGLWNSNMRHGRGVLFYSPRAERASILTN